MTSLVREERYIFRIGAEEHVLRVQELISGTESWPKPFRVQLPAAASRDDKNFYGATPREAAEQAAEYLKQTFM